ncbi:hypothetical protein TCAL_03923 [Tigriopus californicus]|uniref:Enoyl-CoA hydratase n=2 Tax=Tigriopus californicus TaxID=6832 RepID=A0A553NFB4_TIGCA|nr:hypothetical protein TCAL_03923 [Tigriopus californicus]
MWSRLARVGTAAGASNGPPGAWIRPLAPLAGVVPHRLNSNAVLCEYQNADTLALVTLNDAPKLNALTVAMGNQLVDVVEELKTKSQLRAVIVQGAGRAFSAGGDLDWLMERHRDTHGNNQKIMVDFYKRFLCLRNVPVPVIACINGPAIGAGFCLALGGCDIRVAHDKAKLGLTFVKLGLHPGMAITHFLPLMVGPSLTYEMLLTGRLIDAQEAFDLGMVSRISADPLKDAMDIAQEIATVAPIAVRSTIKTLRKSQDRPTSLEEAMTYESQGQAVTYPTNDLVEGIKALREKRSPVFKDD